MLNPNNQQYRKNVRNILLNVAILNYVLKVNIKKQ